MNLRSLFRTLIVLACVALAGNAFAQAGNDNPGGVTAEYSGSVNTAGHYDPYTGNAKREIDDIVVAGSIGAYPLKFTRALDTRGAGARNQFGEGGGWSHSYTWGLVIHQPNQNDGEDGWYSGPAGALGYPEGATVDLWNPDDPEELLPDVNGKHGAADKLVNNGNGHYELRRADGGKVLFEPGSTATAYRAYAIIDPYLQTTSLAYDSQGRLWRVTEPGGRYLEFFYQNFGYWTQTNTPMWTSEDVISMVRSNDGRGNVIESVSYEYEAVWITNAAMSSRMYNLKTAYYDDGSQASYSYEPANTDYQAYGTTYSTAQVVHSCDDPRYAGPMKQIQYQYVQRNEAAPGVVGRGHIRAEKNLYGQIVSQTSCPSSLTDPAFRQRTETRGDGQSRLFNYPAAPNSPGYSFTWTDFKNHTFTDAIVASPPGWRITDPRWNATTCEVEPALGALRKITHPGDASTTEYTFTDPSRPYNHSGEKDENGNWTYLDRDGNNRVWQMRYPDGSTEQFTYNGFGQVLTHKLRSGGTETCTYDARGLKQTSYPPATENDPDPWNHPTSYFYYQSGPNTDRLYHVNDPYGNATWFEYNQRGQTTKVTHQDGTYTQSAYNSDGTLAWTADENHPSAATDANQRTRYTYDEYKRVLTVTNPMNETVTNYYGLDWANPLYHTTNSVKYTISPMNKNVVYDYDENFRKRAQTIASGSADVATTWFDYDEVGNLTQTTDPRSNMTTFGYDARNRKIWMNDALSSDRNVNGHTLEWQYDGVGNKLKETRADDAFRSWVYDIPNRTTYAIDWRLSVSEPAVTTVHSHDVQDRTELTTDAKGAVYTSNFDALHRKISQAYPPDAYGAVRGESFSYDSVGNLIQYKNPADQYKHLTYDSRNRLTDTTWDVPPFNGRLIAFQANANNLYVTAENAGSSPLIANRSGPGLWEQFELIDLGNGYVAFRSMVNGLYVCAENAGTSPLVANRAAIGAWEQFQLVDAGGGYTALVARANGMYVCAESAGANSLIANRTAFGAWEKFRLLSLLSALPAVHYDLDAASRMTKVRTNGGETTVSFGYDDANRRIWEEQTLIGYPTRRVETPRDGDGNRRCLQVPGSYYVDYQYTGRNQLKAVNGFAHFAYDQAGNLIYRGADWIYPSGASYAHDALNRVTQIDQGNAWFVFSRSNYQFDKAGREVATWRDDQGGKGEWFQYNVLGQLTKVRYNADQAWTGSPANWDRWVDYDYAAGSLNRNYVNDNGDMRVYAAAATNQYTGGMGFTFPVL
jgi:YD repeat-containing protein